MTIQEVMQIPLDEPERLFGINTGKEKYHALLKEWYGPSTRGDKNAGEVVIRLQELFKRWENKKSHGTLSEPFTYSLIQTNGKAYNVSFLKRSQFELGEEILGKSHVTYLINKKDKDLYNNAQKSMGIRKFPNDKFRAQMEHYLPNPKYAFETKDKYVLAMTKGSDCLSLRDVCNYYNNKLDYHHAAWIISGLLNLTCWLQYANISHGAISLDSVFISPPHHSIALLGGWWYTVPLGSKLIALPSKTANIIPSDILRSKIADPRIDLTLIRSLGREILGVERTPRKDVPLDFSKWLFMPSSGKAVDDYANWEKAREKFGPRKFVKLEINQDTIYPPSERKTYG